MLTNTTDAAVGSAPCHEAMLSKMAQLLVTDVVYSRYAVKQVDPSIAAIKDTKAITEGSRYRQVAKAGAPSVRMLGFPECALLPRRSCSRYSGDPA